MDLMLEKIGDLPQHKNALLKARKVSNFIYNHGFILAMMRKFTNRELIRPSVTRFATTFLTLESMLQAKQSLEAMFTSTDWAKSTWASKSESKAIKKIILNDNTFWPSVVYALTTTRLLVKVLRMVDSEQMPAMGFIYDAMDEAKEHIAKNLGNEIGKYKEIWEIIDAKWEHQLHRDIHAAAHFLNPRFQSADNFSNHIEIKKGLLSCMEKLIPSSDLSKDKCAIGCVSRETRTFWDRAIIGHLLDKNICKLVHTKRRNKLLTSRLNSLVYVMYNKKLRDRHWKKQVKGDVDPLEVEHLSFDDEWYVDNNETQDNESSGNNTTPMSDGEFQDLLDNVPVLQIEEGPSSRRPRGRGSNKRKKKSITNKGKHY
ncbi:uncharacterized protein LOC131025744 [Salvia miltiorrhiza]|uniref:uncharacterized protein LOC131025744 n=1 Tax=Salvia miltiorrhiza TaxID=226208 RepID=UPI0025AB97A3|nr:uncharacterized protein LOC131025744 [Salvia miltiorrhiza]